MYVRQLDALTKNNPDMKVGELTKAFGSALTSETEGAELLKVVQSISSGENLDVDDVARRLEMIAVVVQPISNPRDKCSGFGIRIPVVAVRFRNFTKREPIAVGSVGMTNDRDVIDAITPITETTDLRGPIASGVGAGYHFSAVCWPDYGSIGPNVSAFSQGFNPTTGEFQIGIATGFQVNIKNVFSFGFEIGYDLVRFEKLSDGTKISNGLFAFKNMLGPSLSYMFTLEIGVGPSK